MNKELLLQPVVIARNEKEKVLIEGSINSVRLSISLKKSDKIEEVLVDRFSRFLAQRAEDFVILRRAPIKVSRVLRCHISSGGKKMINIITQVFNFFCLFVACGLFSLNLMWSRDMISAF